MTIANQGSGESTDATLAAQRGPADQEAEPAGEGGWFNCEVTMAGPGEDGNVYLHLRELNGEFDRWYTAVPAVRKEMLATALAAMSADRNVRAKLTTTDAYGVVDRLFVR